MVTREEFDQMYIEYPEIQECSQKNDCILCREMNKKTHCHFADEINKNKKLKLFYFYLNHPKPDF
ncbi:MAG: hypothetical protein ACE5J3_05815 [Methanosarcinales archaeon]